MAGKLNKFILIGIVILGMWMRLTGINWDEYQHLNPDERFLTMVLGGMKWPGLSQYFVTSVSTFNPVNVGFGFFVYGTLPLFINWFVANLIGKGDYNGYVIVGRGLSALFDTGTIISTFYLGREIVRKIVNDNEAIMAGLAAAFFYAISIVPIQNSHFFIVDTFANFFVVSTLLFLYKLVNFPSATKSILCGCCFGMALSCKLSTLLFLPGVLIGLILISNWKEMFSSAMLMATFSYVTFRIFMPYAFDSYSLFKMDSRFSENNNTVRKLVSGEIDFPPSIQWAGTNFVWPVQEMVVWGFGLPVGIASMFALGWCLGLFVSNRLYCWIPAGVALVIPFAYQANLLGKAQRYFLGAYPLVVIVLAIWLVFMRKRKYGTVLFLGIGCAMFVWALMFTRIYKVPHSRIAASRWIYTSIPRGSRVGIEHWDDPLPLLVDRNIGGVYPGVELSLYDNENEAKREKLIADLNKIDYVFMSSNRLWGSIPKMPNRYPLATKYYELLFSERLGFSKIAEFNSYPGIGRIRVRDDLSEEPFTVYDHPRVIIFMKSPEFSDFKIRELFADVDFAKVKHALARDLPVMSWKGTFSTD